MAASSRGSLLSAEKLTSSVFTVNQRMPWPAARIRPPGMGPGGPPRASSAPSTRHWAPTCASPKPSARCGTSPSTPAGSRSAWHHEPGDRRPRPAPGDGLDRAQCTERVLRPGLSGIAFLDVQRQSLELAEESLSNNRARVEVGTMVPIDVVETEAEVASNREPWSWPRGSSRVRRTCCAR